MHSMHFRNLIPKPSTPDERRRRTIDAAITRVFKAKTLRLMGKVPVRRSAAAPAGGKAYGASTGAFRGAVASTKTSGVGWLLWRI